MHFHLDVGRSIASSPISFKGANVHDVKLGFNTINDVQIKIAGSTALADKGYNSSKLKKDMKRTVRSAVGER